MAIKTIDLAVIIPTLNEEKYIGILLDSIASQTVLPKEIVVVDAYSKDKTIEEIKKRQISLPQLKFYQIKKDTISKQRNLGVFKTKSDKILFLDADMELKDPQTLEKYLEEIEERKPDLAAAINLPNSQYWKDVVYFKLMDWFFRIIKPIWPLCVGMNLYVKREAFNKAGRFDELIRIGEDMELVQRMVKKRWRFIFLKNPKIYTSARRFKKEGRKKFTFKMFKAFYYVLRYGYQGNKIKYDFGEF